MVIQEVIQEEPEWSDISDEFAEQIINAFGRMTQKLSTMDRRQRKLALKLDDIERKLDMIIVSLPKPQDSQTGSRDAQG